MSSSDEPPYGEQPPDPGQPYGHQPGPPPPPGQPPYGAQPGGYGYQPYGYGPPVAAAPQTSVMAILSLVVGIIGLLACCTFIFSIAAVVLGFLGKKEVAESHGARSGGGMATAGLVLGIVGIVLGILYIVGSVLANVAFYEFDYDTY